MAPSVHQYIRISGQAHERGVAYGSFAKERILKVIDEYKVLFDKEAHLPWKDAVRMAKRYEPAIRAYRPDLIDEMKGIAEGAGVPFDVILTLNCRSEVMFAKSEAPADECSVIGVPQEASGNGKTYLAQNWDWWSIGAGTTVILEVYERPYPKALIVTEAGLVGGKGLNAAGVGVSLNAMSVKKGQIGVPLHVILRNAVQQPQSRRRLIRSRRRSARVQPAWVSRARTVSWLRLNTHLPISISFSQTAIRSATPITGSPPICSRRERRPAIHSHRLLRVSTASGALPARKKAI